MGTGAQFPCQTPLELLGDRVSLEVKGGDCPPLLGTVELHLHTVSSVGHPNMRGINKLE